jgi:hypothetical protein
MLEFLSFKNYTKRVDIFHHVDSDYLGPNKADITGYYYYIDTDYQRSASSNNIHEDCKLISVMTAKPHIAVFEITPFAYFLCQYRCEIRSVSQHSYLFMMCRGKILMHRCYSI